MVLAGYVEINRQQCYNIACHNAKSLLAWILCSPNRG